MVVRHWSDQRAWRVATGAGLVAYGAVAIWRGELKLRFRGTYAKRVARGGRALLIGVLIMLLGFVILFLLNDYDVR